MSERHADESRQNTLGYALAASGALGVAAGILAMTYPAKVSDDIWSYPFAFHFFVGFSIVLAITHLLTLAGYLGVRRVAGRHGGRPVSLGLGAAIIGFALLAGCEIASASIGDKDIHTSAADTVSSGFGIASLLYAIGTLVAAMMLIRRRLWNPLGAWSLAASALVMIVLVTPANIADNETLREAALTLWSVCFVPAGMTLVRRSAAPRVAAPVC
jgi:hypothetical protein